VERRRRFEAEHPEVTIVPPGNQWHAVVPLGAIPDRPDGTMVSDWELEGLMGQLEEIWPPAGGPAPDPGPEMKTCGGRAGPPGSGSDPRSVTRHSP
jgi:hypothetical protein